MVQRVAPGNRQAAVLHQDEKERNEGTEFRPPGQLQPGVLVLHNVGMVKALVPNQSEVRPPVLVTTR